MCNMYKTLISLAPNDGSTPPCQQLGEQRWGHHIPPPRPLPRSPLYLSHNASASPEHRPTSSLTPRVVSRITTHNTPGYIFAQPPRRPRTFRHQTNSFSFDYSEPPNYADEQQRVPSCLTNETTPRPAEDLHLHEELYERSLQSSVGASTRPFSGTRHREISDQPAIHEQSLEDIEHSSHDFIFSSPQLHHEDSSDEMSVSSSPRLPLPPPFSTVPRSTSGSESLPGPINHNMPTSQASPLMQPSSTPVRSGVEGRQSTPNSKQGEMRSRSDAFSTPPVR
jgi:hypothetical protein